MKSPGRILAVAASLLLPACATLQPAAPERGVVSIAVLPQRSLPGAGPLIEAYLAEITPGLVPSSELLALTGAPQDLCARSGLDACIRPQVDRDADKYRITLTLIVRNNTLQESTSVPAREISQGLYNTFSSLMASAVSRSILPASMWNSDAQIRTARLVRPQLESLDAFGKGIEAETVRPEEATVYYRSALAVDPDFALPYARLFYTVYHAQPLSAAAETDLLMQNRFRIDSHTSYWLALAFKDLGSRALKNGLPRTAESYFQRAMALLSSEGRDASAAGALTLFGLGDASLKSRLSIPALYNFHAAEQALESSGAEESFLFVAGKVRIGAAYLLDDKPGLAAHSYERAGAIVKRLGLEDSASYAMILANAGLLAMRQRNAEEALAKYDEALDVLRRNHLSQTALYLAIAAHRGNAQRLLGRINQAEDSFNQVISESKVLGLEGSLVSAEAMYSNGMLSMVRGDILRAQLLMISAQTAMARLGAQRGAPDYLPFEMLGGGDGQYSADEVRILSSYCGAFSYQSHSRWVQARTYEGRLDDTNVFLKDLLDSRRTASAALNHLRARFLPDPELSGRGVVFIDIGPAIANLANPGVTAVSLARDFPGMDVIALDLPEQVEIFERTVLPYLRQRVLGFPNLHVFAGNGIEPLASQFQNPGAWLKRQSVNPAGRPIVIRAANSIDIYESWETNRRAFDAIVRELRRLAGDLPVQSKHSLQAARCSTLLYCGHPVHCRLRPPV